MPLMFCVCLLLHKGKLFCIVISRRSCSGAHICWQARLVDVTRGRFGHEPTDPGNTLHGNCLAHHDAGQPTQTLTLTRPCLFSRPFHCLRRACKTFCWATWAYPLFAGPKHPARRCYCLALSPLPPPHLLAAQKLVSLILW